MTYDFMALRGLYAKYTGGLTPQQDQLVSTWMATAAGQHVGGHLRKVLCTSWRNVPVVYFGDSGSLNKFRKSHPSMLAYCTEWLKRSMGAVRDFITGGANIADWVHTFRENRDSIAPPDEVRSYRPADLTNEGWNVVRPGTLCLQQEPVWAAPDFDVDGHVAPDNVLVLIDCMNSWGDASRRKRQRPIGCGR